MNRVGRAALVVTMAAAGAWADPLPRTIRGQDAERGDRGEPAGVTPQQGKPLYVQEELRLESRRPVRLVAFSPDGRSLLRSSGTDLSFWDLTGADPVERPPVTARSLDVLRGGFDSAAFSPDGKTLALGGRDKSVRLFAVGPDQSLAPLSDATEHDAAVASLAFNSAGTTLASGGDDGVIYLWSVAKGQLRQQAIIRVLHAVFGVKRLAFFPGRASMVACCGDGSVRIFDLVGRGSPAERGTYKFPSQFDLPMGISPATGAVAFGSKEDVRLLGRTGATTCFHAHKGNVTDLAWSADGRAFATTGDDGRLVVWDANGRVRYEVMRPKKFTSVAFSPADPKGGPLRVAAANENGTVYLLRLGDAPIPDPQAPAVPPVAPAVNGHARPVVYVDGR